MSNDSIGKAIDNLSRWVERDEWTELWKAVCEAHFECLSDIAETIEDPLAALDETDLAVLEMFMLEDFFSAWFGDDDLNIVDDFLKRRGWRETPTARRYLEALRDSVPSLYEVVDVVPGESISVRDLLRGGDTVTVREESGSRTAAVWDRFAGRVVSVDGTRLFTGGVLILPYELAGVIQSSFRETVAKAEKELREEALEHGDESQITRDTAVELILRIQPTARMVSQAWLVNTIEGSSAPLPELRNTDDEDLVLCDVRFPVIGDRARVVSALDGESALEPDGNEGWIWYAEGSPDRSGQDSRSPKMLEAVVGARSMGYAVLGDGVLVMSVNSVERAERARTFLTSLLGDLVGPALIVHQDPHTVLAEWDGTAPQEEPPIPPEEAEQLIHAYMDKHYRQALDAPIPMFDGKTPREAVATRKGHSQVIDWLKMIENMESRRASRQGQRPYDTAWLWRELGIEIPR